MYIGYFIRTFRFRVYRCIMTVWVSWCVKGVRDFCLDESFGCFCEFSVFSRCWLITKFGIVFHGGVAELFRGVYFIVVEKDIFVGGVGGVYGF